MVTQPRPNDPIDNFVDDLEPSRRPFDRLGLDPACSSPCLASNSVPQPYPQTRSNAMRRKDFIIEFTTKPSPHPAAGKSTASPPRNMCRVPSVAKFND